MTFGVDGSGYDIDHSHQYRKEIDIVAEKMNGSVGSTKIVYQINRTIGIMNKAQEDTGL